MPTIFTHAICGAAIAQLVAPCSERGKLSVIAATCAVLPDVDAIGLRYGIAYSGLLGHRGLTHSLLFAGIATFVAMTAVWNKARTAESVRVLLCVFVATASHGILDALTNGGMGVAFFAPFDDTRYFLPVTPISVSPLSATALLTRRGSEVLRSEVAWVWAPCLFATVIARFVRCRGGHESKATHLETQVG